MMSEKLAHLMGYIEGCEIDANTKEGKIINSLTAILLEMVDTISSLEEEVADLGDQVDEIDEALQDVEDLIYDEDDCDDDECDCDECSEEDFDGDMYEITCPNCNETLCIGEDIIEAGGITCPNCHEHLEFEFEDNCDCGCCDCEDHGCEDGCCHKDEE